MVKGSFMQVWKGDFCLKRFSFSWFQLVCLSLPRVVLHFRNGKREGASSSESLQGARWSFLHLFSCCYMLHMLASSSWLLPAVLLVCFLCAYATCGVKFGHVFCLKIFQIWSHSCLGISLVACLSPGAGGVWTLLSQRRPAFFKGWGFVVLW